MHITHDIINITYHISCIAHMIFWIWYKTNCLGLTLGSDGAHELVQEHGDDNVEQEVARNDNVWHKKYNLYVWLYVIYYISHV